LKGDEAELFGTAASNGPIVLGSHERWVWNIDE